MSTDKPFLSFVVEPGLLKRVDDFRFKNRFDSRAAAIKWLLAWALGMESGCSRSGCNNLVYEFTSGAGKSESRCRDHAQDADWKKRHRKRIDEGIGEDVKPGK